MVSDLKSFYEAVFIDNLTYTREKISKYPSIVKAGYYSIEAHFFLISFFIISILISIFEYKSIKKTIVNLRVMCSKNNSFYLLLAITNSLVVVLTKRGEHFYKYYGATPILVILGILLISSICSRKSLDRLCLLALITTGIFYFWSFSKIDFIFGKKINF